ncbi:MAG: DUF2344 domain-containing protein [Chloroflexi bacterium]|nr:DUF2344 domain-containing protein [Chloroflexota bacterium]
MQRLRIKYSRGPELKYLAHLDLMRLWERALRRAEVPLSYSEGFTPHAHISMALPLPVEVTGEAELMDAFLRRRISPFYFVTRVSRQLPQGIAISQVEEVSPTAPSLQSVVSFADYQVKVAGPATRAELETAIQRLLDAAELPWQHQRDKETKRYDLRALIDDIYIQGQQDGLWVLGMRLVCDWRGSGRAEQVTAALGLKAYPCSIHRARLILHSGR